MPSAHCISGHQPVKEEIIAKPCSCGTNQTMPVVGSDEMERTRIVTRDANLPLRDSQLAISVILFVNTMVKKPECDDCDKREGDSKSPLCAGLTIWRASATVERQETQDENNLVDELAPPLHSKCESDISSSMQFVPGARVRASSPFHGPCACHRIFSTNTK
jgi:hypothetical protein